MGELTHFNAAGEAHMVDVGTKPATHRVAVAAGRIRVRAQTLALVESGGHAKGDVLGIISGPMGREAHDVRARISGIVMGHAVSPLVHQGDGLVHIAETE